MEQWITQELERTELGDTRRTKRLIKIVENLSAKPEASVPQASETWAQTKATYDFWDSPYIKPSMIRQGHIDATVERITQHSPLLSLSENICHFRILELLYSKRSRDSFLITNTRPIFF
ncbi:IS4/Tn5 family transposase DNA-binding protein [Nostoc sp.]|uniref:IS4/Tn5 family transposase DNA-binding protein n=1 Tax=Nostoc sp. TaxID=1180 RepID=UPI002FF77F56